MIQFPANHGIAVWCGELRALAGLLGLLALVLLASPLLAQSADTVQVYPPTRFTNESTNPNTWMFSEDSFTADTLAGWRYVVEVVQGSPALSKLNLSVGARQYVGNSDFGTYVTRLLRVVDVGAGGNGLALGLKGSYGAWIDVRVVRVKEPTYTVFGRKEYVKTSSSDSACTDTFRIPADAASVHTLHLYNGTPGGASRLTTGYVNLNGTNVVGNGDLGTGHATATHDVGLLPHDTFNTVRIGNSSAAGTRLTLWFTVTDNTPPVITLAAPFDTTDTLYTSASSVTVSGTVIDSIAGLLDLGHHRFLTPGPFSQTLSLPVDGRYPDTLYAISAARLDAKLVRLVIRDTQPPTLTINTPSEGGMTTTASSLTIAGRWADMTRTVVTIDGQTAGVGTGDTISYSYPLDLGPNRLTFRAVDALGHQTEFTRFVFRQSSELAPRDSSAVLVAAGTLPATQITSFLDGVKFLYTASPLIQTGVVPASIQANLAAVIHGQVTSRDYGALPNVRVEILGHPEFGQTLTANDGRFDLVVNGGTQLMARFTKAGYLEAQRPVFPKWNEYALVDSVAMIGRSAKVDTVDLAAPHVVRGRFRTDANGDRAIRIFFRPGTVARIVPSPGDTVSFSTIRVRATEFTVGSDGHSAMPGLLPPSTAYTYCVDLSLDEAEDLRVPGGPEPQVLFTDTVSCYLPNFLALPVGTPVPTGSYDPGAGQWKASPDGRIIRILSTAGGTATVDSDNDSLADNLLGLTSGELAGLAQEYAPNDVLWRIAVDHFSYQDYNYNMDRIRAEQAPRAGRAGQPAALVENCVECPGSIIEVENRVLGERIPVVGTPYSLNYRSFRAAGDLAMRTLRIPVRRDTVPSGLQRIIVLVELAGRRLRAELSPQDSIATVPWDGRDVFGRAVPGSIEAQVSIGYQFRVAYAASTDGQGFGSSSATGSRIATPSGDREVGRISWTRQRVSLGAPTAASDGLGGWTLSPHHFYDLTGRGAVYFGDGSVRLGERNYPIITTLGQPVTANDVARAPDGTVYVAGLYAIYKLPPAGAWVPVAGTGNPGDYLDGVAATSSPLTKPRQLTVGPDGSIYFVMESEGSCNCQRACRITPDGIVHSIAGDGRHHLPATGDGGPATAAGFAVPYSIALGPDGSVFVGDRETYTVRRIAPNGIISRYAGTGQHGTAGNTLTGIATTVALVSINGLCTDADGNLYIAEAENFSVRKVAPDGTLTTVVADPSNFAFKPNDLALAPDGTLYVAHGNANDNAINWVYRVSPDGSVSAVAGGGPLSGPYTANNIPALGAGFWAPLGIDIAPDGGIYLATRHFQSGSLRKIASDLSDGSGTELIVPSEGGDEFYLFNLQGQHLRTRDALTGATLFTFNYDSENRLASIYDVNGDSMRIERDLGGQPQAIVGPYGQRTELTLDPSGNLATVSNPAHETTTLVTSASGLLESFTDPNQHQSQFSYGGDGRLTEDRDAALATQTLTRVQEGAMRTVTRTSGEGRNWTHTVSDLLNGTQQRRVVGPDQRLWYLSDSVDARLRSWSPEGLTVVDSLAPEPRFGMKAPLLGRRSERLQSGIERTLAVDHAGTEASYDPPTTDGVWTENLAVNGRAPYATEYNSATRVLTSRSPQGRTSTTTLDAAGRPLAVALPGLEPLALSYDGHGRLTRLEQGARGWRYDYDARGRLLSVRDSTRLTVRFVAYDAADRVTAEELPGGRRVEFGHDAAGNLTSLAPPGRPAHGFDYTTVDLVERYRPPQAGLPVNATRYQYDRDRALTRIERPDGLEVTIAYDASLGRLNSITLPGGAIEYSYQAATGQVDSVTSPAGVTVHLSYDGPLRTGERWSGAVTGSVTTTPDRDFRPVRQQVNGGSEVVFGYDNDGLLTQAGGLVITRDPGNGLITGTTLGGVTTSETPNTFGEPGHFTATAGGTTVYEAGYTRDGAGRITQVEETVLGSSVTKVYTYSDSGFLATVSETGRGTERYGYDGNGNRLWFESPEDTASALYDDQDRLVRYRGTHYEYTAAGELQRKLVPVLEGSQGAGGLPVDTAAVTTYGYDALGNLLSVVLPGQDTVAYRADGMNRRVERRLNGMVTHRWLYQGALAPVAEVDSAGNIQTRYVYGRRVNVPEYMIRGGVTYRLLSDHLGSVRLVVDVAADTVAQRLDYDAWGRVLLDTNPGFQPFGFAGGLWDGATGLVRFGARDYDPSVGRWTCRDPSGFQAAANRYTYAESSPLQWIDPDGSKPISPEEGQKIADEARNWYGTPYGTGPLGGAGAQKGVGADCSGAVWAIYKAAGFPYPYARAADFPGNPQFKKASGNSRQAGDVGWWKGHLVIYDPNASSSCGCGARSDSDTWSASHQGGRPFGPAPQRWYSERGKPVWYRYDK